jgi:3-oxoacyl-[acyl-carrier-protein] synthase II
VSREAPVWITGVGMATPLGHTFRAVADNLLAGKSGVRAVDRFDASKHASQIFAPVEPISAPAGWDEAAFQRLDPYEQMLLWCATQALQDAGWWQRRTEARLGLALGFGAEWLRTWETDRAGGGNRVRDPRQDRETLLHVTQRKLGLTGPAVTVAAACASANYALA